jgi:hypothetical protein
MLLPSHTDYLDEQLCSPILRHVTIMARHETLMHVMEAAIVIGQEGSAETLNGGGDASCLDDTVRDCRLVSRG